MSNHRRGGGVGGRVCLASSVQADLVVTGSYQPTNHNLVAAYLDTMNLKSGPSVLPLQPELQRKVSSFIHRVSSHWARHAVWFHSHPPPPTTTGATGTTRAPVSVGRIAGLVGARSRNHLSVVRRPGTLAPPTRSAF